MATCIDVIAEALTWRGVLAAGRAPKAGDAAGALTALKGVYLQVAKAQVLKPITVSADYTAGENEQIADVSGSSVPISLPKTITVHQPICRSDGTQTFTRTPIDRSVVKIVGPCGTQTFLYDASLADWIKIESLALTSQAPLDGGFHDGLVAALCLAVRYPGVPIDPVAVQTANAFRSHMIARWDIPSPAVQADYF